MLKIGLTGGIGCGKSTVCAIFQSFGVAIIDADVISRTLVEPGQPALVQLVEQFGADILADDGSLDRAALRELAFSDPLKKEQPENIMHPLIYSRIVGEIDKLTGKYCIVAVPLLLETQKAHMVDRVLIVDCSIDTQIDRVMRRDGVSQQQVLSIFASQIPREERLKLADDILDNSTNTTQLAEQIKRLHNSYLFLASPRT